MPRMLTTVMSAIGVLVICLSIKYAIDSFGPGVDAGNKAVQTEFASVYDLAGPLQSVIGTAVKELRARAWDIQPIEYAGRNMFKVNGKSVLFLYSNFGPNIPRPDKNKARYLIRADSVDILERTDGYIIPIIGNTNHILIIPMRIVLHGLRSADARKGQDGVEKYYFEVVQNGDGWNFSCAGGNISVSPYYNAHDLLSK